MTTAARKRPPARPARKPVSIFDARAVVNPGTIVELSRADAATPVWKDDVGRRFMVGFYSKQDGLDCIWLVNEGGEYEQTTDLESLLRYFTIAKPSHINDLYGVRTAKLPACPKTRPG